MLNNPSRVFFSSRKGRKRRKRGSSGTSRTRGTKRYDPLLYGASRELKQRLFWATLVNRKCTFYNPEQWFCSNFQLNCLYKCKETSKQYTFYSVKSYYKGKVFTSGWRGRSCDRLPQKIFRNSNENHIFNTLHKVYPWKEKPIYFNYELFSQLILS